VTAPTYLSNKPLTLDYPDTVCIYVASAIMGSPLFEICVGEGWAVRAVASNVIIVLEQ
jgi:hypothetical protein